MRHTLAALCALIAALYASSGVQAQIATEHTQTALASIENAKKLAALGRGALLLVGDALSTEQAPSENVIVVLEYPVIKDMKPEMLLMVARNGCEPIESCLLARRVSKIGAGGAVQTDPYTIAGLLFAEVKVTLLGSVAYAIDMDTGTIRDMRAGHHQELLTLSQAMTREQGRQRGSRTTPL